MKKILILSGILAVSSLFAIDVNVAKTQVKQDIKNMIVQYQKLDGCVDKSKVENDIKTCMQNFQKELQEKQNPTLKMKKEDAKYITKYGSGSDLIYVIDTLCPACIQEVSNALNSNGNISVVYFPFHQNAPEIAAYLLKAPKNIVKTYYNDARKQENLQELYKTTDAIKFLNTKYKTNVNVSKDDVEKIKKQQSDFNSKYPIKYTPTKMKLEN